MENWQKNSVRNNLPQLIELTKCDPKFLALLKSKGVLGEADLDSLSATLFTKGGLAQASELYSILVTRTASYECLINASFECNQTGILEILVPQFDKYSSCNSSFIKACGMQLNWEIVFKKPVLFQGSRCSLEKLFGFTKKADVAKIIENEITGSDFLKLFTSADQSFVMVKKTIPDKQPCYIERSLSTRNQIGKLVFLRSDIDDIFVFTGIEWSRLTALVAPNQTQRSTSQLKRLSVRFILLEREHDFHQICQLSQHRTVHLIEHKTGSYYLLESWGTLNKIRKYLLTQETVFTEETLIRKAHDMLKGHVFCLSDTPGMGKSILLGNIAQLLTTDINTLSIYTTLSEIGHKLLNLKTYGSPAYTQNTILNILVGFITESELAHKLVKLLLQTWKKPVYLFLDGYDEILPEQVELVKKFLKDTRRLMGNTSIFVTTRPHLRHELEELFGVISYNILPFTVSDQIRFLTSYWSHTNYIRPNKKLEDLAKSCLSHLQRNMKCIEHDITGIPLQCAILAQVYSNEAKLCWETNDDFHFQAIPETKTISGMYKLLVDMRFGRLTSDSYEILTLEHIHFAIETVFPNWLHALKSLLHKMTKFRGEWTEDRDLAQLYSIGILEKGAHHQPTFIHRTLAEYFIAQFVLATLKQSSQFEASVFKHFKMFLWETILSPQRNEFSNIHIFRNSTIVYFLDEKLAIFQCLDCPLPHPQIVAPPSELSVGEEEFHHIFLCCIIHDLSNIFGLVRNCYLLLLNAEQLKRCNLIATYRHQLLLRAAKHASADLFRDCYNLVFELEGSVELNSKTCKPTPLHIAVKRGYYPIVEFLLNNYDSIDGMRLLHDCVADSSSEQIYVILEKVQIIKLLLRRDRRLLNERNSFGFTPLLRHKIHITLVQCLIENGADLRGGGTVGTTLLHRAAAYMSPEVFHSLISFLCRKNYGALLNIRGRNGKTALHEAVTFLEVEDKTLELVSTIPGVDYNEKDERGNNVLLCAVTGGRSTRVLEAIMKHGGDQKLKNNLNQSVLHLAVKVGHLEALRLFIRIGENVNSRNYNRRTPLHLAFRWNVRNAYEMVKCLIENGAEVNCVDVFGYTPLWYALNRCSLSNDGCIFMQAVDYMKAAGGKQFPPRYMRLMSCFIPNRSLDAADSFYFKK